MEKKGTREERLNQLLIYVRKDRSKLPRSLKGAIERAEGQSGSLSDEILSRLILDWMGFSE